MSSNYRRLSSDPDVKSNDPEFYTLGLRMRRMVDISRVIKRDELQEKPSYDHVCAYVEVLQRYRDNVNLYKEISGSSVLATTTWAETHVESALKECENYILQLKKLERYQFATTLSC